MKIKVHSWGGLGSQLFALAVAFDINRKTPKKDIELIHHTAGVTKRFFELEDMINSKSTLKIIDDYKAPDNRLQNSSGTFIRGFIVRGIKLILNKTRISINLDDTPNLNRLKPWTLEVRGHYSKRQIENDFFEECIRFFINFDIDPEDLSKTLTVHYRLGDLLTITEKTFIAPYRVIRCIEEIKKVYPLEKAIIYSDSTEKAKIKLKKMNDMFSLVNFIDVPTQKVVQNSINSSYFLGTNSKVSIWIVKLRNHLGVPSQIID
jgi:hypothetical protein